MNDYDAIIVGGGPAGSCAGRFLAEKGAKCLLLDKSIFPRHKICAGGMTHRAIEEFPFLKTYIETESYLGHLHGTSTTIEIKVKSDPNPIIHYSRREILDAGLLNEAKNAGVEVKEGQRVTGVEQNEDHVIVTCKDQQQYKGKVLLGADGVQSVVRKATGLEQYWHKHDLCVVFEAEVETDEATVTELYTEERITHVFMLYKGIRGYAWIFPKKRHINIGVGVFWEAYNAKQTRELYQQFITECKEDNLLPKIDFPKPKGWVLHMAGPLETFTSKRTMLLGDAAAFVNPLSGEGIYFAIKSANLAAEQLNRFFTNEIDLQTAFDQYENNCMTKFGHEFRKLTKYQKRYGHLLNLPVQICRKDPVFADLIAEFSTGRKSFQQVKRKAIKRFLLGMLTLRFR